MKTIVFLILAFGSALSLAANSEHTSAPFGTIFGTTSSGLFKETTTSCVPVRADKYDLVKNVQAIAYKTQNGLALGTAMKKL